MSSVKPSTDILFLPGLLNNRDLWQPVCTLLPDHIGTHFFETHHWPSMDQIVEATLLRAPKKFVLVGFSMGGYVALEILHKAPERVQGLALLNTKAISDNDKEQRQRISAIHAAEKVPDAQFLGVSPRLFRKLVADIHQDNTSIAERVYAMASAVGRKGFIQQQRACLVRADRRLVLQDFSKPCLLLSGEEDHLIKPENSLAILPKGEHERVILSDVGHLSPLEAPQKVTDKLVDLCHRSLEVASD